VIPLRKQSGVGVMSALSRTKKALAPVAFGDLAAPVEHQGVVIALLLRLEPGEGADHVEARGLGFGRRGVGRGAAPGRDVEPEALPDRLLAEIGAPRPAGDGEVGFDVCAVTPICSEPRQATGRI
jgi:hypothetical protein